MLVWLPILSCPRIASWISRILLFFLFFCFHSDNSHECLKEHGTKYRRKEYNQQRHHYNETAVLWVNLKAQGKSNGSSDQTGIPADLDFFWLQWEWFSEDHVHKWQHIDWDGSRDWEDQKEQSSHSECLPISINSENANACVSDVVPR